MFNNDLPWATVGVWVLTIIFAIVGGAVVVWGHNGALSFEQYMKIMGAFVVAHGVLGIGRGQAAAAKTQAAAQVAGSTDEALLYGGDLPTDEAGETLAKKPGSV